ADAAARAGATGRGNYVTAQSRAVQFAAANSVDGTPVTLDPATDDIEFGNWDDVTDIFTPVTDTARNYANAIRINARRTIAKGNAITLTFARVLGVNTCDVKAI